MGRGMNTSYVVVKMSGYLLPLARRRSAAGEGAGGVRAGIPVCLPNWITGKNN